MAEVGWREGREYTLIQLERLMADPIEQATQRMLAEKPDLILATSTAYANAAHRQTRTIPIVMWVSGYPVEAGVAHSLARPGKNVTGNTSYAGWDIWGKLLELLRDAKPSIKRVTVLWTYAPPWFPEEEREPGFKLLKQAAQKLGLAVSIVDALAPDRLADYFAQIDAARPDALILTSAVSFIPERTRIMQFAIARRLPMITDVRWGEPSPIRCWFTAPRCRISCGRPLSISFASPAVRIREISRSRCRQGLTSASA